MLKVNYNIVNIEGRNTKQLASNTNRAFGDVNQVRSSVSLRVRSRRGIQNRLTRMKSDIGNLESEINNLSAFLIYASDQYKACEYGINRKAESLYEVNNSRWTSIASTLYANPVLALRQLVGINYTSIIREGLLNYSWPIQFIGSRTSAFETGAEATVGNHALSCAWLGVISWFSPWWNRMKHFWDYSENDNTVQYGPRRDTVDTSIINAEMPSRIGGANGDFPHLSGAPYNADLFKSDVDDHEEPIFFVDETINGNTNVVSSIDTDNIALDVDFYSQYDNKLSSGCAIVAGTLALQYLGGQSDPKEMYNYMVDKYGSRNMNWGEAAKQSGLTNVTIADSGSNNHISESNVLENTVDSIRNNIPVVIRIQHSDGTHFVLAYGIKDSGGKMADIMVIDPGRSEGAYKRIGENNYTLQTAVDYWGANAYVDRTVIYKIN